MSSNDDILIQIIKRQDDIFDLISQQKEILAKQQESLNYHIKRTDLLEEDLRPVKKHVYMINGFLKGFGAVSVLLGILKIAHDYLF